jgi:segregation and condensation protein B
MERRDAQNILEALLFITEQPVPLKSFSTLFDDEFPPEELRAMAEDIAHQYAERGSPLELREIAGGWQFSSRPEFAPWIRKLFKDRLTYRLSASAMETLSIIAYKQPITRSEIEEIRGVEVSAVLDTLVERHLVRMAGRKETVGRPILYATTPDFLKAFGLVNLDGLPSIESLTPPAEVQVPQESEAL